MDIPVSVPVHGYFGIPVKARVSAPTGTGTRDTGMPRVRIWSFGHVNTREKVTGISVGIPVSNLSRTTLARFLQRETNAVRRTARTPLGIIARYLLRR